MDQLETIVIPLSKLKTIKLIIFSAIFMALGFWMFNLDNSTIESGARYKSPVFVHTIGILAMAMGIIAICGITKKIFSNSSGLVINSAGIIDNSSLFSAGLVQWDLISGFKTVFIKNQPTLYVLLKNPDAYINNCNPLKKHMLRALKNIAPSPVGISPALLKIDLTKLVSTLESGLENHAKNT